MTNDELDAIEATANAATIGGPYYLVNRQGTGFGPPPLPQTLTLYTKTHEEILQLRGHNVDADRAFIEHGRRDIQALVAEVRRLRAILADASSFSFGVGDGGEEDGYQLPIAIVELEVPVEGPRSWVVTTEYGSTASFEEDALDEALSFARNYAADDDDDLTNCTPPSAR